MFQNLSYGFFLFLQEASVRERTRVPDVLHSPRNNTLEGFYDLCVHYSVSDVTETAQVTVTPQQSQITWRLITTRFRTTINAFRFRARHSASLNLAITRGEPAAICRLCDVSIHILSGFKEQAERFGFSFSPLL